MPIAILSLSFGGGADLTRLEDTTVACASARRSRLSPGPARVLPPRVSGPPGSLAPPDLVRRDDEPNDERDREHECNTCPKTDERADADGESGIEQDREKNHAGESSLAQAQTRMVEPFLVERLRHGLPGDLDRAVPGATIGA